MCPVLENDDLLIAYGPDRAAEGDLIMSGITEFRWKRFDIDFAVVLDAYGYGYARYHSGRPRAFRATRAGGGLTEARVTAEGGVHVVKTDRLFAGRPVLEIEYERLRSKERAAANLLGDPPDRPVTREMMLEELLRAGAARPSPAGR